MLQANRSPFRFFLAVAVAIGLSAVFLISPTHGGSPQRFPLPQDWSHSHLIFSVPGSYQSALQVGQNMRFWHQWIRRSRGGPLLVQVHGSTTAINRKHLEETLLQEERLGRVAGCRRNCWRWHVSIGKIFV